MPQRIQMTRSHPWRAEHPDAVIVDRRTRWGNPFRLLATRAPRVWMVTHHGERVSAWAVRDDAAKDAVRRFAGAIELGWGDVPASDEIRAELTGRDLCCWCDLASPCHADVLLSIANTTPAAGFAAQPPAGAHIGAAGVINEGTQEK